MKIRHILTLLLMTIQHINAFDHKPSTSIAEPTLLMAKDFDLLSKGAQIGILKFRNKMISDLIHYSKNTLDKNDVFSYKSRRIAIIEYLRSKTNIKHWHDHAMVSVGLSMGNSYFNNGGHEFFEEKLQEFIKDLEKTDYPNLVTPDIGQDGYHSAVISWLWEDILIMVTKINELDIPYDTEFRKIEITEKVTQYLMAKDSHHSGPKLLQKLKDNCWANLY